jgi:hypothetical protein
MAGIAYVRKRLYNPELIIDTNGVLPNSLRNYYKGKAKPLYFIKWKGTTQAGEELGTAAASVKDGTTTPFQITVVSSDVADKRATAAGAVHSVALIGVSVASISDYQLGNETPKSTVEVVAMNGTTDVLSTRYYLWVDHAYACEWGTGATDATGDITIESPANTELLKITATYNESDGGVWHFVSGKDLRTVKVKIMTTEALAASDGVVLSGTFTGFDQTNNTDPDINVDYYSYIEYGNGGREFGEALRSRRTTNNSKVLWSEALVANAKDLDLEIYQVIED